MLLTGALETTIKTIPVLLLPDKAVFLPDQSLLLIADVHIGKANSFRRLGVPVPPGTTLSNLERIDTLLESTNAQHLAVLGDLFHSDASQTPAIARSVTSAILRWRNRNSNLELTLIAGNHDARVKGFAAQLGFKVEVEPHCLSDKFGIDVHLLHEPRFAQSLKNLKGLCFAGHIHPVMRIKGRVDSARLPCFWHQQPTQNQDLVVLPSFGSFTGGHVIERSAQDRVFVTDGEQVHALPPAGHLK